MKLATLCYIRKDNKTLMMHRIKKNQDMHEGKWNGLGGKLHAGESPEECAIREVKEESGLDVKNGVLKGILTFPGFFGDDWYCYVYLFNNPTGEIIEDCPEGKLEWIPTKEIMNLSLWPSDLQFIPLLDKAGIFSAKFTYNESKELIDSIIHRYHHD